MITLQAIYINLHQVLVSRLQTHGQARQYRQQMPMLSH